MGVKDGPSICTPRLEAFRAALEVHGYPRELWSWLMDGATMIHRLCNQLDVVNWYEELGKGYSDVRIEDVG